MTYRYFILNKPRDMVSQFKSSHDVKLLGDIDFDFPDETHAIGRLDRDSEGLLLLTTNPRITRLLFSGPVKHNRTYLVQLNNVISDENLERLRNGVAIRTGAHEMYITPPCPVSLVELPHPEYQMVEKIEKTIGDHCWITISLTEGKFRQVRKMIASIRHRCKRLIRVSIEDICLDDLEPGKIRELPEEEFFQKLRI